MKTNLLSMLFFCLLMACKTSTSLITRIDIDQHMEMISKEDVIVIDVRTPAEVTAGYIKGTKKFINYKDARFKELIGSLDKANTYVVYCKSGNRSTKALNIMADMGFEKLYELEGGITSVKNSEYIIQ